MTRDELATEALKQIDRDGLKRVRGVFSKTTHDKFFDIDNFIGYAAEHALRYDAELPRNASCIDVGCGFGYVALCLEILGHSCVAWDAPAPVLKNVSQHIPVKKWIFKQIVRERETHELIGEYDLIFMHGVIPMRDAGGWWEWPDYARFFSGLFAGLKPGGRLEIIANHGDQIPVACVPANWSAIMETGLTFGISDNLVSVRREMPVLV